MRRHSWRESPVGRLASWDQGYLRMLILLDTSHELETCAAELGCEVGQLLTPLTRYRLQNPAMPWAIDNGAFSEFDERAFLSLLSRESHHKEKAIFVCAPDVVGSARRTLEIFHEWKRNLAGWNIALVIQDGQENLPIPWDEISAVFIGGSTEYKISAHVRHIIKAAQVLKKWVHIGRVNDPRRFEYFNDLGANSCDGTGISRYSHMRVAIARRHCQLKLISNEG